MYTRASYTYACTHVHVQVSAKEGLKHVHMCLVYVRMYTCASYTYACTHVHVQVSAKEALKHPFLHDGGAPCPPYKLNSADKTGEAGPYIYIY